MPAPLARIQSILPDIDPRPILAWMRANTGNTFNSLSDDDFASHARFAAQLVAQSPKVSARLADIMGV